MHQSTDSVAALDILDLFRNTSQPPEYDCDFSATVSAFFP